MKVIEPWKPELSDEQKRIAEKALMAARRIGGKADLEKAELNLKHKEDERKFLELLGIKKKKEK